MTEPAGKSAPIRETCPKNALTFHGLNVLLEDQTGGRSPSYERQNGGVHRVMRPNSRIKAVVTMISTSFACARNKAISASMNSCTSASQRG
jgi:hypothetical protein